MKKIWNVCIFLCLTAAIGPGLVVHAGVSSGQGDNMALPHMFNVPGGDSAVILQNLDASQQVINVEFFAQDGSFVDIIAVTVPGLGEGQAATPAGPTGQFQGSVIIFGNAPYAARGQWNFSLTATPVSVGVPALPLREAASTFQLPIGSVGANSLVGVAVQNPFGSNLNCTAVYRDFNGQAIAEDQFQIEAFGQAAGFANGLASGFEGSGTISCDDAAVVVAVIQEQVNGFPTPLFAPPAG